MNLVRQQNLNTILQLVINHGPISRSEIARLTGMSRTTVSSIFEALIEDEVVIESGIGSSTDTGGRKPKLYEFNRHYGYVVSFNITSNELWMMTLSVGGEVLDKTNQPLNSHNLSVMIKKMTQYIDQILVSKKDEKVKFIGIGISVHAVVDKNKIVDAPFISIDDVDLNEFMSQHYKVPVIMENEANLSAIYARDYGEINYDDLIVMSIHRGLGVGIIANHRLFTGYRGLAGEAGRMHFRNEVGEFHEVSDMCAEDYLVSCVANAIGKPGQRLDYREVSELFKQKDSRIIPLIPYFAELIGENVYNLVNVYGAEIVYLNSDLLERLPMVVNEIEHYVHRTGLDIKIRMMAHSDFVPIFGVTVLVIRKYFGLEEAELKLNWSTL